MSEPHAHESEVNQGTARAEAEEAQAQHVADRPPTPEEEAAADRQALSPETAASYQEMAEMGATIKGEGEIE